MTTAVTRAGRARAAEPSQRRARRGRSARRKDDAFGYTLLAPQLIGFVAFCAVPLVQAFFLSLHDVNSLSGEQSFVGLANYERVLTDPNMATISTNTAVYTVILSTGGTLLALALALLVNQKLRGIKIFRVSFFVPALVTLAAWSLIWGFILQPAGLLDTFIAIFGAEPVPWLRERGIALPLMAIILMVKNVGLNMMVLLAALQTVPGELMDAAEADGANLWQRFRAVTLPHVSGSVLMVLMFMIVGSFRAFEQILLLTGGGPGVQTTVLPFEVYRQAFVSNNVGYGSALAVILFLIVMVISAGVWQLRKKVVFHEAG